VLVHDLTQDATFKNLENWRDEFLSQAAPSKPDEFPFVALGTESPFGVFTLHLLRACLLLERERCGRSVVGPPMNEVRREPCDE